MGEEYFPSLWRGRSVWGDQAPVRHWGLLYRVPALASWAVHPVWAGTFGHSVTVTGAPKWLQGSTPEGGDGVQDGEHLRRPSSSSRK